MRKLLSLLPVIFCLLLMAAFSMRSHGQCTTPISSFPYFENFEATNGNWAPGGTMSDWSWGLPVKSVINAASGSSKCWITGGLAASSYNLNENSFLQSPCFNLSSLTNPYIRFKVFWETERKYDGASFQYSINGGTTWTTLGSYNDYVACPANNWFNTSNVNALGRDGWSGNVQLTAVCPGGAGSGSGAWVTAQHEMTALAGQTNVMFRFTFAAGSVCNNYNGFAIDDIQITEAPGATGNFQYDCNGSNTITVTPSVAGCNVSYLWDFGDPASGSANVSTLSNPTHFYADPGTYPVKMIATAPGFAPVTVTWPVTILQVDVAVSQPIRCFGEKTGLTASVIPVGTYKYSWNTSPVQTTPGITGVGKGSYTVLVGGTLTCPATEFVVLTEPAKLESPVKEENPFCGRSNGSAKALAAGGTAPYSYTWSPGSSTTDSIGDLAPGNYSVQVTDANGCTVVAPVELNDVNNLRVNLGNDTLICPGQRLILSPGAFDSYKWQDNSTGPAFTVTTTGNYAVTVTNDSGCVATDEVKIVVDCSDLYFPTGFTPDGNGRNDGFGALGNLLAVKNYSLRVFNRWGEQVFVTSDPSKKWNGLTNGVSAPTASFTWLATYEIPTFKGKQVRKGVVTLIR